MTTLMRTSHHGAALALGAAVSILCSSCEEPSEDLGTEEGDVEFRVVDPTPAADDELLGMVLVETWRGDCSGMVIASDRILTAAHCFCTESTVGGNVCVPDATVTFRPDPADPTAPQVELDGTATWHPGYNPSWTELQIEDDLAVVDLVGTVPAHATPFKVAKNHLPSGSTVMVTGFGHTGSGCDGPRGTLNYDIDTIDGYEDGTDLMRFNDTVFCGGDSGGAVLDLDATTIYGVNSNGVWTLSHGWVNKSIAVDEYREWIRDYSCSNSFWSLCDDKGPICQCAHGGADCDVHADCEDGLVCAQNVGAFYGFSSGTDVCEPPFFPQLNVEFTGCFFGLPRFAVDWAAGGGTPPDTYDLDVRAGAGSYGSFYNGGSAGSQLYTGANNRSDSFRLRVCSGGDCSPFTYRSTGSLDCGGGGGGGPHPL